MTGEWAALVIARWLNFAAVAGLFGMTLFPLYVSDEARRAFLERPVARGLMVAGGALALASSVGWASAALVNMAGSWSVLWDKEAWSDFFFATSFGYVWIVRFVLAVTIALTVTAAQSRIKVAALASLSAGLLVSQAWLGHVASLPEREKWCVAAAYVLHVLGAGAWFGGLLSLAIAMTGARGSLSARRADEDILARFSGVGFIAVAAIVVGGVVNVVAQNGISIGKLAVADWGQVLAAKLALVSIMLLLACMNRFILMPRWANGEERARRALLRGVLTEQILGLLVLGLTAVLGTLDPAA